MSFHAAEVTSAPAKRLLLAGTAAGVWKGGIVWMMTRSGRKPDLTDEDRRRRELESLRTELQTLSNDPTAHIVENDRG